MIQPSRSAKRQNRADKPEPAFDAPVHAMSGPAYSRYSRCLASAVVWGLAVYGWRVSDRFPISAYSFGVKALIALSLFVLLLCWWHFLTSKTTIDANGIRQTWIFNKEVQWRELRSAKMIGIPFLHRLFPPRLVLQTNQGYFITFHGGTQELMTQFARIALSRPRLPS